MVLAKANLAYWAIPFSMSGNKLESKDLSSSLWSSTSNIFGNSNKWLDRPSGQDLNLPKIKNAFFGGLFIETLPWSSLVLHLMMRFPWTCELLHFWCQISVLNKQLKAGWESQNVFYTKGRMTVPKQMTQCKIEFTYASHCVSKSDAS